MITKHVFLFIACLGVILVLPCTDKWDRVDMRVKAFNVPPQKVEFMLS